MNRKCWLWLGLIFVFLLAACDRSPALAPASEQPETVRRLVILYTNDEHGWMEATGETGGAAGLMGLWREAGYTEDGPYLILSGGDTWTGPAISTWLDGESMIEVMNLMGYDAVAIGNHEFDFGRDGLRERAAQSEFPFLSANIRDQDTGAVADVALPYVIRQVNGVQVGLIGLTTTVAPQITMPDLVAGLDFIPYKEALEQVVPQIEAEGAQLLVVVGHICASEMRALAPAAARLDVAVIGGGHCHELVSSVVEGVAIIEGGDNMQSYARVDLAFDTATGKVVSVEANTHVNVGGAPDPEVAAEVARWRDVVDEALGRVIGYAEDEIGQRSDAMFNMVADAWLLAYPSADVALINRGSFRQAIPAGDITLATIVGVLPFNNVLIDVELDGAQLIESIECCRPVVGGMTTIGGYRLSDGAPLDPAATYHVLVNDFMYAGGDGHRFQEYDPAAYNTSIDWRQPVIDWIISLHTSPDDPLDNYLDTRPR